MTAQKDVYLWCDHEECQGNDAYNQRLDHKTFKAIRAAAARDGWTFRNGKDFCPDHPGDQS